MAEVFSVVSINLAMVEDGQAFADRHDLSSCHAREDLDAEVRASRSRYGVWQVSGGISRPWHFRSGRRYRCHAIGSLDSNSDGEACESLC